MQQIEAIYVYSEQLIIYQACCALFMLKSLLIHIDCHAKGNNLLEFFINLLLIWYKCAYACLL